MDFPHNYADNVTVLSKPCPYDRGREAGIFCFPLSVYDLSLNLALFHELSGFKFGFALKILSQSCGMRFTQSGTCQCRASAALGQERGVKEKREK